MNKMQTMLLEVACSVEVGIPEVSCAHPSKMALLRNSLFVNCRFLQFVQIKQQFVLAYFKKK